MLSRLGLAAAAIALFASTGVAQSTDSERDVRTAQAARIAAVVGQDVNRLGTILDETLIYGHTTGATDTKASYLDRVRTGSLRYLKIVPQDMKVNVYGDT